MHSALPARGVRHRQPFQPQPPGRHAGDSSARWPSGLGAVKGVLASTPFRRLWYCTGLSSLGDWLGLLATTALATQLATGYQAQNYALGGVLVVRLLPSVLLGPLAGAFADRFDRRLTMVITDLIAVRAVPAIPICLTPLHRAVRRHLPDRVHRAVLEPGQGRLGAQPGPQGPARGRQPAQPDHHLRPDPGRGRGAVLPAGADLQLAGPALLVLQHQPGQPGAVLQRGHLPGRRADRAVHPRDLSGPPRR